MTNKAKALVCGLAAAGLFSLSDLTHDLFEEYKHQPTEITNSQEIREGAYLITSYLTQTIGTGAAIFALYYVAGSLRRKEDEEQSSNI